MRGDIHGYGGHLVMADGPAGPRARLRRGPDVWELVGVEPDVRDPDERVAAIAEYLSLSEAEVRAALDYYANHHAEVDEFVAENERAYREGYAQWLAKRAQSQ